MYTMYTVYIVYTILCTVLYICVYISRGFKSHLSSSFFFEKEMFMFVVLPCFDLCRSNSYHELIHHVTQGEEKKWELCIALFLAY